MADVFHLETVLPRSGSAIFEPRYTLPKLLQICFHMASFGHLSVQIWIKPFPNPGTPSQSYVADHPGTLKKILKCPQCSRGDRQLAGDSPPAPGRIVPISKRRLSTMRRIYIFVGKYLSRGFENPRPLYKSHSLCECCPGASNPPPGQGSSPTRLRSGQKTCPNVAKCIKTNDGRLARVHLKIWEAHLDRQASSESAPEHIENTFGSTGVERERIWAHRTRIWIDSRRAREHLSI